MNFSTGTLVAGLFALCTALFWGTYGPLLSRGHHLMGTEGRLRPFICVGIAYLLVAIVGPIVVMYTTGIDKGDGIASGRINSGSCPPSKPRRPYLCNFWIRRHGRHSEGSGRHGLAGLQRGLLGGDACNGASDESTWSELSRTGGL